MMNDYIEDEIVVHPIHGMQLSEGYIRKDNASGFLGCLPGLLPYKGKTKDKKKHPGLLRPQGHFAFLGHGDVLEFKDIKVKTLGRP